MEKRIFKTTGQVVSISELASTFTTAQLLEEFNAYSISQGGVPLNKFRDRTTAERRTWDCMAPSIDTALEELAKAEAQDPTGMKFKILGRPTAEIEKDMDNLGIPAPKEVGGTPVTPPVTPATDPMVFCDKCGRSVPKSSVFTLPCSTGGTKSYCKKEDGCKKSKASKISLKEQAQAITAQVAIKKAPKAPKTPKGPNPNIGKFDNCLLRAKENKRANSESIRSAIYNHIASNQGCTIKDMEKDGVALLPVLRDCVKKLFADLKIEISGWEVVTPRTLNFREVK